MARKIVAVPPTVDDVKEEDQSEVLTISQETDVDTDAEEEEGIKMNRFVIRALLRMQKRFAHLRK